MNGRAFQIEKQDNVAIALSELQPGLVNIIGAQCKELEISMRISEGHKFALYDIKAGTAIIKYGVCIGIATRNIVAGTWVHLNCMKSLFDKRSSHLDVVTGKPKDIKYE